MKPITKENSDYLRPFGNQRCYAKVVDVSGNFETVLNL